MWAGPTGWLLSIDFGTSNTAAAHTSESSGAVQALPLSHVGNLIPSSVFVCDPTQIEVGEVALNKAAGEPSCFIAAPKRSLTLGQTVFQAGRWEVPAPAVVAAVLRSIVARARARHGDRPPAGLVLTHPEAWSAEQIRVLTDAAADVGYPLDQVQTVSEPQAAAHSYTDTDRVDPGSSIVVFDLGGGTLDVAVLRAAADGTFDVLAARGDNALGGGNFDACVRGWVDAELAERNPDLRSRLRDAAMLDMRALEESIRKAKELLSDTPSAAVDVRVGGLHERLLLTRHEFESMIEPQLARAVRLTRDTIGLAAVDRVQTIFLSGGSSLIPKLHRQLGAIAPVATLGDPKTVVAQGAIVAARRRSARPPKHRRVEPVAPLARGADIETEALVKFYDAMRGMTTMLRVDGQRTCSACDGGDIDVVRKHCTDCQGTGLQERPGIIVLQVPPGVADGHRIRVPGKGAVAVSGGPPGDLYITVRVGSNPVFLRYRDDLVVTMPISRRDLLVGASISVPTLDGSVLVRVPAGSRDGRVLRVPGRGAPIPDRGVGDLLVTLRAAKSRFLVSS